MRGSAAQLRTRLKFKWHLRCPNDKTCQTQSNAEINGDNQIHVDNWSRTSKMNGSSSTSCTRNRRSLDAFSPHSTPNTTQFTSELLFSVPATEFQDASVGASCAQQVQLPSQLSMSSDATILSNNALLHLASNSELTLHPFVDSYLEDAILCPPAFHTSHSSAAWERLGSISTSHLGTLGTTDPAFHKRLTIQGWSAEEVTGIKGSSNEQLLRLLLYVIDNNMLEDAPTREILLHFMRLAPEWTIKELLRMQEPFADKFAEKLVPLAAEAQSWEILRLLLKRPLSRHVQEIAFTAAMQAQNTNAVKDLLAISGFSNQTLYLEPRYSFWPVHPLVFASAKRNVDLVRALLDAKSDANPWKFTHNGPLHSMPLCAAITGEYVMRNVPAGDRFATEQFDGRHITIQPLARLELIHALVDAGADINPVIPLALRGRASLEWTRVPIQAAIAQGHVELVRYLLSRGALVGSALMTYSAFQILFSEVTNIREPEAVAIAVDLISRGADVNEEFEWAPPAWLETPRTPLTCAARQGNLVLVHLLINSGAKQGDEAVLQAVEGRHIQVAESLLDLGIVPADFARTLTEASTAHMYTVVERMISLAKRSNDLWHFAYVGSNAEAVQMLLDSEAVPENGTQLEAAIEAAIRINNVALLRQILDVATANQGNWDLGSLRGVSLAISLDRLEIVEQLLDFGLPVDAEVFAAAVSKKSLPFIKHLMGLVFYSPGWVL